MLERGNRQLKPNRNIKSVVSGAETVLRRQVKPGRNRVCGAAQIGSGDLRLL